MKFLSRVVWSEGMHLGPHHFQTQSRYFEDTLWFLNSNLRQEPWGFLHFSLDAEALRNGLAILSFASGILPDGLISDFPDCDLAGGAQVRYGAVQRALPLDLGGATFDLTIIMES
jgi:type VI secretion system protein ImpJ